MNKNELKSKLRVAMIRKRDLLNPVQVNAANLRGVLLANLIIEHYHPHLVGIYWPKGREFPTQACIDTLSQAGIRICLPVVKESDLEFYRFSGEEHLSKGPFGVLAPPVEEEKRINPIEIEVLIIPGVAFDRQLCRDP